jgi:hypothetical protein
MDEEILSGPFFDMHLDAVEPDTLDTPIEETPMDTPLEDAPIDQPDTTIQSDEISDYDAYFSRPENFENETSALNWYQERFSKLEQMLDPNNQYLQEYIQEQAQTMIKQKELEIESYGEMFQALRANPKMFMMQYMPEALAEHGISPVLTNEQILQKVQETLMQEYGNDYHLRVNMNEMLIPGSQASQVWIRQQELTKHYQDMNSKNQEVMNNWNKSLAAGKTPISANELEQNPEQYQRLLDESYEKDFQTRGFTKDEFMHVVNQAKDYKLTMTDVERIINFETYVRAAYEQGIKHGTGNVYNKVKNNGGVEYVANSTPVRNGRAISDDFDEFDIYRSLGNNTIPHY